MAYFFITDPTLAKKTLELQGVQRRWEYEKNNEPIFKPDASILQGLYSATLWTKYNKPMQYFGSRKEIFEAYEKNSSIEVDEIIDLLGKQTTYGREKVSDIIGTNLDDIVGEKTPISAKNIVAIMRLLTWCPDNVERHKQLQDLALDTVTYAGNTTISLEDVFTSDPSTPEIHKIVNSNLDDPLKYRELDKFLKKEMERQVREEFNNENLVKIIDGSGKVKAAALPSLLGPRIEYTKEHGLRVYDCSIAQGYDEGAHISHAIENRDILILKQSFVPLAGFFARQCISLCYDITFTEEPSVSKNGIVGKAKDLQGRTKLDGSPVTEKGDTFIRVKSCIDGTEDRVCREEVAKGKFAMDTYREGDAIGISFAASFSESITQSGLALKHGGNVVSPSKEHLVSITPGKVTKVTKEYLVVTHLRKDYMYPIPENAVLMDVCRNGKEFVEGTELAYCPTPVRSEYNVEVILSMISAYSDMEKVKRKDVPSGICYAPCDGIITYNLNLAKPKKSTVSVGSMKFKYNPDFYYLYPNGYQVKKGDRISSGVIDLPEFQKLVGDYGWTFYAFKDQATSSLKPIADLNSELFEVLFKVLIKGNFSIRRTHKKIGKLLNEINLGYAREAVSKYIGKDIGEGLLTKLMLENI